MERGIRIITQNEYTERFTSLATSALQSNRLPIEIYRIEEYAKYLKTPTPPFRTSFNFLTMVTQGEIRQQVETDVQQIVENSALNIQQGHITANLHVSSNVKGYYLIYQNEVFNSLLSHQSLLKLFSVHPYTKLSTEASRWLVSLFELLLEEYSAESPNTDVCISLFQTALQKIISSNSAITTPTSRSVELTFAFKELVYTHHVSKKAVSYYASQLAVSENYLDRCLKQTTGKGPKTWINEISILQSKLMLQDLTRDISQIAFELNYEDPSYFARLFRKITGTTPTEYRRALMHDLS